MLMRGVVRTALRTSSRVTMNVSLGAAESQFSQIRIEDIS